MIQTACADLSRAAQANKLRPTVIYITRPSHSPSRILKRTRLENEVVDGNIRITLFTKSLGKGDG